MKKLYLLGIVLFGLFNSFSQEKLTNEKYTKYFENTREVPFLHLNKTSFLQGEEIWFKAYIQEQNSQKPHPTTTNLYVSIFNEDTTLKSQQLVMVNEGTGYGSILLDSTFTGKNYYLKASTRWMKNFNEDNAYYQKIRIASSKSKDQKKTVSEKEYFEFKLFPEGGHFVANTLNNIGILIKDYKNEGVKIKKGIIKDKNGNTVRYFNTNNFGMNSVRLFLKENESYSFHAILSNDIEIKTSITNIETKGISLIINNKKDEEVTVNVITNKSTLNSIAGKKYRILVHNTRSYRNFPFVFKEDNYNHALILKQDELTPGINIITIFNDENTPIAERLIFVKSEKLFQNVRVSNTKIMKNDSVAVKFTNPDKERVFLSASFLPSNTIAYKPKDNIISSFLLKPYIKGHIQSPELLFGKAYKGQKRDLDLLLLIQGWSKYNWTTVFNSPPKVFHEFENGIDITARINKNLTSKQSIVLSSTDNNLVRIIPPTEIPWVLKNSFVKKNSTFKFALNSKDNYYKIAPAISYKGGKLSDFFDTSKINSTNNFELDASNFQPFKSDYESLDEVEVQANKRRRKTENHDKVYGAATMLSSAKMSNRIVGPGETFIDFLKEKRYWDYEQRKPALRGIGNQGTKIIDIKEENGNRFGRPLLRIYLDGEDISQQLWIMEQIYLNTIKEIFFGRIPGTLGEEIYIFSLSPSEYINSKAEFAHVKIPVGFATEKEYYNPLYPSFVNETYQKFGCMYWKPNIELDAYLNETIQIPGNLQEKVNVYIEGITESGKLISKKVTLSLN
ncbi:conserved hypothetical protein [Tenacibaculum sp. 190524A05c]|uniref:hypothetical protein n=1 Tax=Tenacibaculum platacis TaxID=3137852 RepID=UPI0031FAC9C8